jgi:glutamate-1-semialdehyde 2,1-aminomutase
MLVAVAVIARTTAEREVEKQLSQNSSLWKEAIKYLPGGVNSPARACKPVGTEPIFAVKGQGPYIWDADDAKYIDYVCSWGALLLGHTHPRIVESVKNAASRGSSFGLPTPMETELARHVTELVPSVEKLRLVSSGTEATMSAVRLARGVTGRDKVLKFEGCYHGHVDSLLVKAGSGALTLAIPGTPGVPQEHVAQTLVTSFNDIGAVQEIMDREGERVACIIVEPVAGNMGVVPPQDGFLEGLRSVTAASGALLIFDEVITGFRLARGGYQELSGVIPDLTTLGKALGAGLPVGAFGGRAELMNRLAPDGPVYQAGTLSGNPLAVAGGLASMGEILRDGFYPDLEARAMALERGLAEAISSSSVKATVNRVGSMLTLFFTPEEVDGFAAASSSDTNLFGAFFKAMRSRGVNLPPSQFEAWFVSAAHTDEDIERTIEAVRGAFSEIS